jgi:hypothetical protein
MLKVLTDIVCSAPTDEEARVKNMSLKQRMQIAAYAQAKFNRDWPELPKSPRAEVKLNLRG